MMTYVLDLLSNYVTHNIIHDVIEYKTIDSIDNLSDHLPLFVVSLCFISHVHVLPRTGMRF